MPCCAISSSVPRSVSIPRASCIASAEAVRAGEQRHTGEICFAVTKSRCRRSAVLPAASTRAPARSRSSRLRVWDTHANNGVLVCLLLADRRIEIVADRCSLAGQSAPSNWRGPASRWKERLQSGDAGTRRWRGGRGVGPVGRAFPAAARRHTTKTNCRTCRCLLD